LLDLSETNHGDVKGIYIVDWELCKTGLPGLDIGQFCAEIDLVRRFYPEIAQIVGVGLEAFLHAYRGGVDRDLELAKVAAIHVGTHLAVWTPRVPWGDKETTRATVIDGLKHVVGGSEEFGDWLSQSIVGALL